MSSGLFVLFCFMKKSTLHSIEKQRVIFLFVFSQRVNANCFSFCLILNWIENLFLESIWRQ